ncbi:hypothetical protein BKA63DRAFT_106184 [Paraphoma chrysanthemicola]|nr:hypothetical protein BKA63DRAFT_106184 [Paraphoma chrysanthemicola]
MEPRMGHRTIKDDKQRWSSSDDTLVDYDSTLDRNLADAADRSGNLVITVIQLTRSYGPDPEEHADHRHALADRNVPAPNFVQAAIAPLPTQTRLRTDDDLLYGLANVRNALLGQASGEQPLTRQPERKRAMGTNQRGTPPQTRVHQVRPAKSTKRKEDARAEAQRTTEARAPRIHRQPQAGQMQCIEQTHQPQNDGVLKVTRYSEFMESFAQTLLPAREGRTQPLQKSSWRT